MRERGIFGLVLAGGINEEMEMPFGELTYHDRPQWAYSAQMLAPYCDQIFISVDDHGRLPDVPEEMLVVDEYGTSGPAGGLLTALQKYPDHPFFVIACTKPGIDRTVMNRIYRSRDPELAMSCFRKDDQIDALVSFWEPAMASALKPLINDPSPLKKFVSTHECRLVDIEPPLWEKLREVRTQQEREHFLQLYKPGKDPYQVIE